MSRRYLWQQIRAHLLEAVWRLTQRSRSEARIEAYRRRNARIIARQARRG